MICDGNLLRDACQAGGLQLLVLLLLAPLLEEIVFRTGLQESLLRRWPGAGAGDWINAATTLAIAAAHLLSRSPVLGLAVALPAWLIGRTYQQRRKALPCMLLHSGFNAFWILAATYLAPALGRP